jgi:hypothetical protein
MFYYTESNRFLKVPRVEGGQLIIPMGSIKFIEDATDETSILGLDNGEEFAVNCTAEDIWDSLNGEK